MKLIKIGDNGYDNIISNIEYEVILDGNKLFNNELIYYFLKKDSSDVIYFTEPIVKIGRDFLKSKKCKYILIK